MNINVCIVKVENNIGEKTTTVFDLILGSAKKRQSSKKGKRPSSSSNIPALKYPRILDDEGKVCFCLSFFLCIMYMYSRLPITRTFKGNRKKVRVIGSSKKIAESNVKTVFTA